MNYKDWTTYPEDLLEDGVYLIGLWHRLLPFPTIDRITIRTGIVILQEKTASQGAEDMPDFVGEDEMELRLFILNNEDGVEEYNIKKAEV